MVLASQWPGRHTKGSQGGLEPLGSAGPHREGVWLLLFKHLALSPPRLRATSPFRVQTIPLSRTQPGLTSPAPKEGATHVKSLIRQNSLLETQLRAFNLLAECHWLRVYRLWVRKLRDAAGCPAGFQVPQLPAAAGGRGPLLRLGPLPSRARWVRGGEGDGARERRNDNRAGSGWRRAPEGARGGAPGGGARALGAGPRPGRGRGWPRPLRARRPSRAPKPDFGKAYGGAVERFLTSEVASSSVSRAARGTPAGFPPPGFPPRWARASRLAGRRTAEGRGRHGGRQKSAQKPRRRGGWRRAPPPAGAGSRVLWPLN